MATARFGFGDVVLVPFPFTDQTGAKKHPTVVVSSSAYNTARHDSLVKRAGYQAVDYHE